MSWTQIASEVKRTVSRVRAWPQEHPEIWHNAFRAAEAQGTGDNAAEAAYTLRALLRSPDEKIRRDAARLLVHLRLESRKLERRAGAAIDRTPLTEAARIAAEMENTDDARLDSAVAELLDLARSTPDAGPAAPLDGPAGPA